MSDKRENLNDEFEEAKATKSEAEAEAEKETVDNEGTAVDNQDETAINEQEEDQNTKYLRLMADFQNYKRRSEKEKSDIYAYANEKLLAELIGVLDNFERALVHSSDESFSEGMSMIFKNFKDVLEKAGLTEINAVGEDFDPNIHNAIMTDPNSSYESGKVCEVVQKGYMLGDRVVRPSMVKVAE